MGHQQLLILSLTILIVIIASYIGIDLFERSMRQSHVDLLVDHTVMVASEAVAYRIKRSPFLGGGGSYINLNPKGMKALLMAEERLPGRVVISRVTADEVDITAVSYNYPDIGVLTRVVGEEIVETRVAYDGSITLPDE